MRQVNESRKRGKCTACHSLTYNFLLSKLSKTRPFLLSSYSSCSSFSLAFAQFSSFRAIALSYTRVHEWVSVLFSTCVLCFLLTFTLQCNSERQSEKRAPPTTSYSLSPSHIWSAVVNSSAVLRFLLGSMLCFWIIYWGLIKEQHITCWRDSVWQHERKLETRVKSR